MDQINWTRVFLGGLLAGLVINIGEFVLNGILLADQFAALREGFGLGDLAASQLLAGVLITFAYGIVLVWLYAAIRPRFGPGPRTAIIAGLAFWVIAYLLFTLSIWAGGLFTASLVLASVAWGLVEAPLAALAGAWVYREAGPAPATAEFT